MAVDPNNPIVEGVYEGAVPLMEHKIARHRLAKLNDGRPTRAQRAQVGGVIAGIQLGGGQANGDILRGA